MCQYGYEKKNNEGENVLGSCQNHGLLIIKTYSMKEEQKLIPYESGDHSTQIALLLMNKMTGLLCTDCQAIAEED